MLFCLDLLLPELLLAQLQVVQQLAQLEEGTLNTVLKAVGIGLVGEIAALVCGDAGNAALSKAVQIATASAVLWLSVPLMEELLVLIREVLELS